MTSTRTVTLAVALLAVICAAIALITAQDAVADRPFDERMLDGAYHFSVALIREEAGLTVYCNAYGTMLFDGAGSAELPAGWGYGWCTDGSNPVEPNTFTYQVYVDGGVLLTEQASLYTTHCQILDKGKLLLCDGTGGMGGNPHPDEVLWTATAGKL